MLPRAACWSWLHLQVGIALEAPAGLAQEVRRHGEIDLSLGQADVAEVGRELRQQALDVRALAVPGDQPVHSEGVPEIVQARLEVRAVATSMPTRPRMILK